MNTQTYIDATASTFQADAIDASAAQLVLVDFWAAWCGPCRSLAPILEKLAEEFRDSMRLVKVDTDREQALAGQFGIRSLPTVLFLRDGKVVDQFMGALPESAIRQKIEQYAASPVRRALEEARQLHADGRTGDARAVVNDLVAARPEDDEPKLQLLEWLSDEGDLDGAEAVAATLSPDGRDSAAYKAFEAGLEFRRARVDDPDRPGLEKAVDDDPDDLASRYRLAKLLVAGQEYAAAMDQLLEIIRRDRGFEDDGARKTMLKVFDLLGGRGELVSEYRTRLSRTLF